jgi:hypothetical protein
LREVLVQVLDLPVDPFLAENLQEKEE